MCKKRIIVVFLLTSEDASKSSYLQTVILASLAKQPQHTAITIVVFAEQTVMQTSVTAIMW